MYPDVPVGSQLGAQSADVNVQRSGPYLTVIAPNVLEQELSRDNRTPIPLKQVQDLCFLVRQMTFRHSSLPSMCRCHLPFWIPVDRRAREAAGEENPEMRTLLLSR